jgi:hypothetical protein
MFVPGPKQTLEFTAREQLVKNPLIIDGFSRSGKFVLGQLVASLENVEFIQNPFVLETVLYLARLNKIDLDVAKILCQTDCDLNTYNMIIGRNLNTRLDDMSTIHNSSNPEKFLQRAATKNTIELLESYMKNNSLPLYIIHEGLCNANLIFNFYPGSKIINLQRDPVSLIFSWYKRGWGTRFGTDPTSFSISFNSSFKPSPWFAVDWKPSYGDLSVIDRIVKSIFTLTRYAKMEYELLTSNQKSQLLLIDFRDLLTKPDATIKILSLFVNRDIDENISKVIKSLQLPRQISIDSYQSNLEFIKSGLSGESESLEMLQILIQEHQNYWTEICQRP